MATLVTLQGPDAGRSFPLDKDRVIMGRQYDSTICLNGRAVSRHHAQLVLRDGHYFLEDLESSNGTYLNGKRLPPRVAEAVNERDVFQIGPYVFALRPAPTVASTESSLVVRQQVNATVLDQSMYSHDPALKLQVVLEIAQNLGRTLDLEPLLEKMLEQLIKLFPQADRAMVLLCEGEQLVVRGQRCRHVEDASAYPYSRTVVRRALDEGVGLLSEDAGADARFSASATLTSLDLHSVLCVPLIGQGGKRLGVIQVDRFRRGHPFRGEDLQLLATICLQVGVVLENAALHAERLRQQRLHQELAMAREIQQGYLPHALDGFPDASFEIHGEVFPARQVAGDLYDFMKAHDNRLGFYIGDVSGKGMPAALFMVAVHTLCRHLSSLSRHPGATLKQLNTTLSEDNPGGMFVTLIHGLYEPASGEVVLASGGHPPPLLRRADGQVEVLDAPTGRLLGFEEGDFAYPETHVQLAAGDMLIFFTDGAVEAHEPGGRTMFGTDRLMDVARRFTADKPLSVCAELVKNAVDSFTAAKELQDDLTMLILRKK